MTRPSRATEPQIQGFLDNSFVVSQFSDGAHRAGLDALLVAATVPSNLEGNVADFGAGNGAAGFAVAQRCPGTSVDLFEIDTEAFGLMETALAHPQNAHLSSRLRPHCVDVTVSQALRSAAGAACGRYNQIIANPPYNDKNHRKSPNEKRALAHHMTEDGFDTWMRAAASLLATGGTVSLIMRPANLPAILDAMKTRFGAIKIMPVHPKPSQPANRLLINGTKGSRAALQFLPSMTVHRENGSFTDEAEAVFRGHTGIDFGL